MFTRERWKFVLRIDNPHLEMIADIVTLSQKEWLGATRWVRYISGEDCTSHFWSSISKKSTPRDLINRLTIKIRKAISETELSSFKHQLAEFVGIFHNTDSHGIHTDPQIISEDNVTEVLKFDLHSSI